LKILKTIWGLIKMSNTKSLDWHKSAVDKLKEELAIGENKAMMLLEKNKKLDLEIAFYEIQIEAALSQKKSGFDRNKFFLPERLRLRK